MCDTMALENKWVLRDVVNVSIDTENILTKLTLKFEIPNQHGTLVKCWGFVQRLTSKASGTGSVSIVSICGS